MQIDFHHTVIYVLARTAGFLQEEAEIIAYSSQFVDDSIKEMPIRFSNGAMYRPICSAHKALEYRNFDDLANHFVWVPYHFLPGNCMLPLGQGEDREFIERIICRPNSPVAEEMVEECIRKREEPTALYRLGITLHTYADTWAHQGFAGIKSEANKVKYFKDDFVSKNLVTNIAEFFTESFDEDLTALVDEVLPLGHGAVLSYPDRPYLKWRYIDYQGKAIERDNSLEFLKAVEHIYSVMKRFQGEENEELEEEVSRKIHNIFNELKDEDVNVRHKKWLDKIAEGEFSFGREELSYIAHGEGSWENCALENFDTSLSYTYNECFLASNWKKFQDALHDHTYYLIYNVFRKFHICLA